MGTTTWKEVWQRFSSPVVLGGFIILLLNILRVEFGWVIPVESIEHLINYVIIVPTVVIGVLNNPENKHGL